MGDLAPWLSAAPGVAALAWQAFVWLRRHEDASKIERMKGDIRREVEEHLAGQETRLRIASELRLRLHERSGQLLRDLLAAVFETHAAIVDYSFAMVEVDRDRQRVDQLHMRVGDVHSKLQVLAVTAPPDIDVGPMMLALKGAINTTTEALFETSKAERVKRLVEIRRQADEGMSHAGTIARTWNARFWKDIEEFPALART